MKNIFLLLSVVITGCVAVKQEPIHAFDLSKLNDIPYLVLCKDYYTLSKQGRLTDASRLQLENLLKAKGSSEKDLSMAKEGKVYIGMSQCGLYASWGKPRDENSSVNKYGKRIQHIYGSSSKRRYVYTENGKVKSWQN